MLVRCAITTLLTGWLLITGCAADPQNDPTTLNEWNRMSRPKF